MEIINGGITSPKGFLASGVHCGIKKYKKDLAIIYSEVPCDTAAVFTTNKVKAAPVLVSMENIKSDKIQAIVINSGNANACTGEKGLEDAREMVKLVSEFLKIDSSSVLVSSTGVIGVPLPMDKVRNGISMACAELNKMGGQDAVEAIMTTDTCKKEVAIQFEIQGMPIRIGAMAKGSGMIHPNMATMLAFITTDLNIDKTLLQEALKDSVNKSFNMITVDGDTSTNDMVVILANGMAGNRRIMQKDGDYFKFLKALNFVCTELAKMIVRDGEGATKFIEVKAKNAKTIEDAKKAIKAVLNSNLVKTAIFGEDANWGRILAAVGYSGADFDVNKMDIYFKSNDLVVKVAENGAGLMFDEELAKKILVNKEIEIILDFKDGEYEAVGFGCDLSYEYVRINGSYRT